MYCNVCGKKVDDSKKFCTYCGAPLKRTIIDDNATADTLKTRGMMLLEEGDFSAASDYFERLLSVEPENPYGFLGEKMVKLRFRKTDDFVEFYKNLYADNPAEKTFIGEDISEHIADMVSRYSIANYLEAETIESKYYTFDRSVDQYEQSRQAQSEMIKTTFDNDLELSRLNKYADEELKKAISDIFDEYKKRTDDAKKNDKKEKKEKEKQYKEFIETTDKEIEVMHEQALEKQASDYQSVPQNCEEINDVSTIQHYMGVLNNLDGYEDSDMLLQKYNDRLRDIYNRAKKKRTAIAVTAAAAVVLVIVAALLYYFFVIPYNKYNKASAYLAQKKYDEAAEIFEELDGYKDSDDLYKEAMYNVGLNYLEKKEYDQALSIFYDLDDYQDCADMILKSKYLKAISLFENRDYDGAYALFDELSDYEDSQLKKQEVEQEKEANSVILPDLINKTQESSTKALSDLDLRYSISSVEDPGKTPGTVIDMSPEAGSKVLKGTTVTITVTKTLSEYVDYYGDGNTDVLYQINISRSVTRLWIRNTPSIVNNESLTTVSGGDVFNVYETVMNDGYMWYRVGYGQWIADDGTWLYIDGKCDARKGDFEFVTAYLVYDGGSNDYMGVYDEPSENRTRVDTVPYGSTVTVYFRFYDGGYWWYKIGADRWIKDQGGDRVSIYW